MPKVATSTAPARARVGLPIVPDGSAARPLLLRLPTAEGQPMEGSCNNGCRECLTRPVEDEGSSFAADVQGRHVVVRHREALLRRDLPARVAELRSRNPASIALLTNGRLLLYPELGERLARAGVDRFIVKLFGLSAQEHDAHTRDPGSFDQTRRGIAETKGLGAEVLVTFPLELPASDREEIAAARKRLARELTDRDPIVMPEPQVESHPNEFRYDVVVLRDQPSHSLWKESFFPMAHVNTGPACNIRCSYCNVHGGDDQRVYTTDYVERLVDHSAERVLGDDGPVARPTIDFIGGEPTLHPDLPKLIARAKDRGFAEISICTNGVLLRRKGYLDKLVDAGLSIIRFSFHEHRADFANDLAQVPGLGSSYVDVAKMLLGRRDVHTHWYRIILANTIDALDDYIHFLADNNRTGKPIDLTFGMPSMRGRLFENQHLYPPLAGLREKVAAAVELARSVGMEPVIHHAPACLVPDEPFRAACLHVSLKQYDALGAEDETMNFEGDARYGDACERCDGRRQGCHGLPAAYWDADPAAAEQWLRPVRYDASPVALPRPQPRDDPRHRSAERS